MNKLNILSKSVLLALAVSVPSVMAGTYYVPHKVVELSNSPIGNKGNPFFVGANMDISDSGEIVAKIVNGKPVYWSRYDQPTLLTLSSGESPTGTIDKITINADGDIVATTSSTSGLKVAKWDAITHQYSSSYMPYYGNAGGLELNRSGKIGFTRRDIYDPTPLDVSIFNLSSGSYIDTNLYNRFENVSIPPNVKGINDNDIVIATGRRTNETHYFSAYYIDGIMGSAKGVGSDGGSQYEYWSIYNAINNDGLVAGSIDKYFVGGSTRYECIIKDITGGTFEYQFNADALVPVSAISRCNLYGINTSGVSIGTVDYNVQTVQKNISFLISTADQIVRPFLDMIHYDSDVLPSNLTDLVLFRINNRGDILGFNVDSTSGVGIYSYYYFTAEDDTPPPPPPPVPVDVVIDNDNSASTSASNNWVLIHSTIDFIIPYGDEHWTTATSIAGYQGADYFIANQPDGIEKSFTWSYSVETQANYEISIAIPVDGGNDPAAQYELKNGSDVLATLAIDQTQTPSQTYQSLGIYNLTANAKLTITLKGSGQGNLIADAVRLLQTP